MQLLIAVVQAEDADLLVERLTSQQFRVTRINSVGSFLARGNATILVGVEDAQVEAVLAIMRATCHTRRAFINALPYGVDAPHLSLSVPAPLEVQVGGATVFRLPVIRFLRLQGGSAPPATDEKRPTAGREPSAGDQEGHAMNLVMTVLQSEDADLATGGLLAAGYRVTRLNTAGGFLRRGNATLLIGVESEKVDDVLHIIQANCRLCTEPRAPQAGMPMYSATVFVLAADRFIHL